MDSRRLATRLRWRVSRDRILRQVRDVACESRIAVWLVGGLVRDAALGQRGDDIDLVALRGSAKVVKQLQQIWGSRGFRFRKRGVTTWRFSVAGRQVDLVAAPRRGLAEELRRRELTINAVAYDLLAGRLDDPLRGASDLRAKRLRLPRPGVIHDDPIRALRIARFLAQLPGFRLDSAAEREARACAPALRRAAAERVREELDKLLRAPNPARGLNALLRLELQEPVLPELTPMRTCLAGAGRPDVWSHTIDAIAMSANRPRLPGASRLRDDDDRRILRWALLLHDICKPDTLAHRSDGRPTFHGHEVLGARRAGALLLRLRTPGNQRRRITRLIRFHLRPSHLADAGAPARGMRRLLREIGADLPLLVSHSACDAAASGAPDARTRWRRLSPVLRSLLALADAAPPAPPPRLVDGRDVMRVLRLRPGVAVGRILERIRDRQDAGTLRTRRQALDYLAGLADER
jgi:poly(A) polymerase